MLRRRWPAGSTRWAFICLFFLEQYQIFYVSLFESKSLIFQIMTFCWSNFFFYQKKIWAKWWNNSLNFYEDKHDTNTNDSHENEVTWPEIKCLFFQSEIFMPPMWGGGNWVALPKEWDWRVDEWCFRVWEQKIGWSEKSRLAKAGRCCWEIHADKNWDKEMDRTEMWSKNWKKSMQVKDPGAVICIYFLVRLSLHREQHKM